MKTSEVNKDNGSIKIEGFDSAKKVEFPNGDLVLAAENAVRDKAPVGVTELDSILHGGFPKNSLILLSGNAGSGKTILSTQFIFNGATKYGEKGVYVSFAENSNDYFRNMSQLGMDMKSLEERRLSKFLDFVTIKGENATNVIMEKVLEAVSDLRAKRLVIDSLSAILQTLGRAESRIFLHTVLGKLVKSMGITTLLIGEIPYGESRTGFGVEEFIADGVILLRRCRSGNAERKEMEIVKMRGVPLDRSIFEYLIDEKYGGVGVISLPLKAKVRLLTTEKTTTGIEGLDKMLCGGVFRGSITLIEGPTGIGKTTASVQFVHAQAEKGEKALYLSFEEPTSQVIRIMANYGLDRKVLGDRLTFESYVAEALTPLHYYKLLKDVIEIHKPTVIAVESVSSIQHGLARSDLLPFLRYLQLLLKEKGLTAILTSTAGTLEAVTESGVSTLADNVLVLRYLEVKKELAREIMVLKARGSPHEKRIMPFEITGRGMVVHAKGRMGG